MYRIIPAIVIVGSLAACSGTTATTVTTDATNAVECAAALAAAYALDPASIVSVAASNANCAALTANVLAQIEGTAKVQATAARRTMRLR